MRFSLLSDLKILLSQEINEHPERGKKELTLKNDRTASFISSFQRIVHYYSKV